MFQSYKQRLKTKPNALSRSRSEFLRHYSYIALNLRGDNGRRYIKDELLNLYANDDKLRKRVDKEVERMTLRLIDGMRFADNLSHISQPE
jgi:hypothetical protein